MGRFVEVSDFTGDKTLSKAISVNDKIQYYIDKYEPIYLTYLLGCDLYTEFINDLDVDNNPQEQRFMTIFESFCIDDNCGILRSEGFKEMLLCFIYFEYVKDNSFQQTTNGVVQNDYEVSKNVPVSHSNAYDIYNQGINTYQTIQQYICDNSNDYEGFNGQMKQKNSWL